MTQSDVILLAVIAVAVCLLPFALNCLWYGRMAPSHRIALPGTTLRHYTTRTAGQAIDQTDGTVALTPRPGVWGAVTEIAHQNWRGVTHAQRAVYFYAGVPTDVEKRYHNHANEVVVTVSGADLLAQHPGHLHCARRDSAVAVRGGYRGPGTVETTTTGR